MSLHDLIFAVGTWVFVIALLPSVFSPHKPAISTSLMTGTVMAIFTINYLSLHYFLAAVPAGANAVLWLTLAYQRRRR